MKNLSKTDKKKISSIEKIYFKVSILFHHLSSLELSSRMWREFGSQVNVVRSQAPFSSAIISRKIFDSALRKTRKPSIRKIPADTVIAMTNVS